MLILSRKLNESIIIGDQIKLTIIELGEGTVRIGIEAPKEVEIFREEIYLEIQKENQLAAQATLDIDKMEDIWKIGKD